MNTNLRNGQDYALHGVFDSTVSFVAYIMCVICGLVDLVDFGYS